MKLPKKHTSNRTIDRETRDACRAMGLKYPIIPARVFKKTMQKVLFEDMINGCPGGYTL